jgi:hypothetical protein
MSKVTLTDEQFKAFVKKHSARKDRHNRYTSPNGQCVASTIEKDGKRIVTFIRIGI